MGFLNSDAALKL